MNAKKKAAMQKRQRALALALLPHLAIVLHTDYEGVVILDLRTLARRQLSRHDADALLGLEHIWHIHTSILMKVGDQNIIKTDYHPVENRLKQADLVDYLKKHHLAQLKAERQDCVTGYAWIATPVAKELTESRIDQIYDAAVASARRQGV